MTELKNKPRREIRKAKRTGTWKEQTGELAKKLLHASVQAKLTQEEVKESNACYVYKEVQASMSPNFGGDLPVTFST